MYVGVVAHRGDRLERAVEPQAQCLEATVGVDLRGPVYSIGGSGSSWPSSSITKLKTRSWWSAPRGGSFTW